MESHFLLPFPQAAERPRSRPLGRVFAIAAAVLALAAAPAGTSWADDDDDDDDDLTFEPDDVGDAPASDGSQDGAAEPDAQEPEADEFEPDDVSEPAPDLEKDLAGLDTVKADQTIALSESRVAWQDILVVVRKPFLKTGRLEILPLFGVTMNDNIIQHVSAGGQLNYYLTDVLSVGLEGALYARNLREPFDLVARQARRLPTVNEYNFSGALNFSYVPVYGKFAVLDKRIVHWEVSFTAGVGVTQSEVIPRDPALDSFTNILITPNVGASMRFFLTRFITVTAGVRDYVFVDQFEATDRTEMSGDLAKEDASSAFVNHVMFQAGLSFWFPTSFEYTTFR